MFLCSMKTIREALLSFDEPLKLIYDEYEINSIKYLYISEITQLSKVQLKAFPEFELTDEQSKKISDTIQQLKTGKPLQYILGHTEFYGLPFNVNPSVLIPRPETEELVEWVIETAKERNQVENILDIGTGSGCIPVTIKKNMPTARVSAIDISEQALITAQCNAKLNNVDIVFIRMDILNELKSEILIPDANHTMLTKYSIIISNPPYVTENEKTGMHINVLNNEPHLALFVPNNDPLKFYRAIADLALDRLEENGLLFFEINENLSKQTVDILVDKGFKNIVLHKDMRNKDRMIRAEI